jgi:hypothetical protein
MGGRALLPSFGVGITGGLVEDAGIGRSGVVQVNEDPHLMAVLGPQRWRELVYSNIVGLLEDVQAYGKNEYHFSMVQGRVSCASLYTKSEYKSLVVEAQYTCRYHYYRSISEKRHWYWFMHCYVDFADKNALSYHKHKDECHAWKDTEIGRAGPRLKMYPTFPTGDQFGIRSIFKEAGLNFLES